MRRAGSRFTLVGLLGLITLAGAASAADGDKDGTFGNSLPSTGMSITDLGTYTRAFDLAIEADDKIVVAGQTTISAVTQFAVVRYKSDGKDDTNFSGDGAVTTPIGTSATANGVAVQTDGKIVVVGSSTATSTHVTVARYTTDGQLDPVFSPGGLDGTGIAIFPIGSSSVATGVAIQPDGKIVISAFVFNTSYDFAAIRLMPDGALDPDFGVGGADGVGVATFDVSGIGDYDVASAITLQGDGKIVLVGTADAGANNEDFAFLRLMSDGTRDNSFDGDGKVIYPALTSSEDDTALDVVIQRDGRIVAAGFGGPYKHNDFALVRLHSNGAPDLSFDSDGRVTTPVSSADDEAFSLALQTDDKIIAVGYADPATLGPDREYVALRYGTAGNLEFTKKFNLLTGSSQNDTGRALGIQRNNKVVIAGYSNNGTEDRMSVMRMDATSTDSSLSGLALSTGTPSPQFASGTTAYSATVPNTVKSITLTPTTLDPNSTVTVNGVTTTSGSPSASLALVPGTNTFTISARSQDLSTTTAYTLAVTRSFATLKAKKTMTAKNALASADATAPAGAKVRITVSRPSKKICAPAGTKIKGLKAGTCSVTIAVTPKKSAAVKKPTTTRTQVTIIVN